MKKYLSLIIILCTFHTFAQDLIKSRNTSYYTYIFKINDKEALKIYKDKTIDIESDCMYNLIDSFPTDSVYPKTLDPGHYLKVFIEKNKLNFSISTIYPFDIQIVDNNTDLLVQIFDLSGKLISDVKVKVGIKTLHFDKKARAFIHSKSNKKGLLRIQYQGNTYYFDLNRQYNNIKALRLVNNIIYRTPVKYVWLPIRYVIHLPIDGIKSVIWRHSYGVINRTKYFFIKLYKKIACLFDDSYCDEDHFTNKHKTYLVFNKPKYLPGDTVKFKAFICNKKGKAINKPVHVLFYNGNSKNFKLADLKPYRKGAYEYQFFLHDSLDLKLDKYCSISLELRNGKPYVSESFMYEDYELSSVNLGLRSSSLKQYKGKSFEVFVSGKDENDINLPDARVQLILKPKSVDQYFDSCVFIPDTIFFTEKPLDASGETQISIPDSVFPKANLIYELEARLLTSDNDMQKKSLDIQYFHKTLDVELNLRQDSMFFNYSEDGIEKKVNGQIYAIDRFNNSTNIDAQSLPFKAKINPYYSNYLVVTDNFKKSLNLSELDDQMECYTDRNRDSIHISVKNPRNIDFNYFVYKANKEILKGYGQSLEWHKHINSKQNYIVMLQYLWGGKMETKIYMVQLIENKLNIEVTEPNLVYPGQKTTIKLKVLDQKGKPMPDVDLTGFGLTKKFKYSDPDIPEFKKYRKEKSIINSFKLKSKEGKIPNRINLDYKKWRKLTGLDSIAYYQFIYPGKNIYQYSYKSGDSISQFSPFVVNNGQIQAVHIIYIDRLPVYFSWSTNVQPYSFKIDSGYHQIRLRTGTKEYTIDSMYLSAGKKLIFSISDSVKSKYISIVELKPELSYNEKNNLYRYILPYRNNFDKLKAYLDQDNRLIYLKPGENRGYYNFAGPIYPRNLKFSIIDGYTTSFEHEAFFEYEFQLGLLKMRSINIKDYPLQLNSSPKENLNDRLIQKTDIEKEWNDYLEKIRYQNISELNRFYRYNNKTKLIIKLKTQNKDKENQPLFVIIKKLKSLDCYRIQLGETNELSDFDNSYFNVVFIYPGSKYAVYDSLYIKPNGINYFEFEKPEKLLSGIYIPKDDVEKPNMNFIEVNGKPVKKIEEKPINYNTDNYNNWKIIQGRVLDENGESIPGVNIRVKGTQIGTISDLDGNYSLQVPDEASELIFSFVGMSTQEQKINGNLMETKLTSENMALDEVVVVGYGVMRKQSMSYSSVSVESNTLSGKVGGVQITNSSGVPGAAGNIVIRGASSISATSEPLYVIDGVVYTGSDLELNLDQLGNIEVLKGDAATAIYGSRAANGVILITTKGNIKINKNNGAVYDQEFYNAAMSANSIRNNFSDYAFWQPRLKTDKNGIASFDVVFPDDVTGWDTHYMAMNGKKKSGQTKGFIRSYKPLMAQLSVPRFLIEGDSVNIIGKVKNYTNDSVAISTRLEINDSSVFKKDKICADVIIDTIMISANDTDSLSLKYYLQKPDGYFDGEEKKIPVFPIGLEETKGQFFVLDKDTIINPKFDTGLSKVNLYAKADELDVITDEIDGLINYKYGCNEQLSSKLKGLLSLKYICDYKKEKFRYEKETKEIIKLLTKNRQDNGLWGWWNQSGISYWISMHVMEALIKAKEMGYEVSIDAPRIFDNMLWSLEKKSSTNESIRILYLMNQYHITIDHKKYIANLDSIRNKSLFEKLSIIELKQLYGIPISLDTIFTYAKKTLFGNLYFDSKENNPCFYENEIQNTLTAYRIIRRDTSINRDNLQKIRNYLFENRRNGYWLNTYESAKIIETILPDIAHSKSLSKNPVLVISGDINKSIDKFPFEMKFGPEKKISISKTGDNPVYLTTYQRFWNPAPKAKSDDFVIQTAFKDNNAGNELISGKTYTLVATVQVKKDAEYVMIEIPVPAACSYNEKSQRNYSEIHREYFKQKVSIFCEYLKEGTYQYTVEVIPRFTGNYTLNPAKVELMYFPTFNANNEIKKVKVK